LKESAAVYETVSAAEANKDLLALNRTAVLLQLAQEAADLSRREPDNARWTFTEGVYLAQAGKAEEALAAFERTLTLNPNHVDALFNAMSISAALGRSGEAETYAQRLLALPDVDAGLRERAGEMSGGQE
jgi:tetratricopeptide (TPR) repeat protein